MCLGCTPFTKLLHGQITVTLFTTGEEEKLGDAIDNPDIGWEIESEIKEVIRDILRAESPLLKALGTWITVEQNYWGLG